MKALIDWESGPNSGLKKGRINWEKKQFGWEQMEEILFLLNDDFSKSPDIAAGSINGTYSTDGKSLRTVVDTESKLSIANGAAVFAGGKASPAWGDPLLSYPQLIRSPGRAWIFQATPGATTGISSRGNKRQ